MQSPTDVEIKSHRPIIGRLIVAYKKFIRALISPYLRTVFDAERRMVDGRLKDVNRRISLMTDNNRDLVRRMDSIALLLNQKMDDISKRQDELSKKLDEIDCKYGPR